jgi:putative transposase
MKVSVGFFVGVRSVRFQILHRFLVLSHPRRRIVVLAVTAHPRAEWLREASAWDTAPQYLLRDRDQTMGSDSVDEMKAIGIK